jgi:hypothetical protein
MKSSPFSNAEILGNLKAQVALRSLTLALAFSNWIGTSAVGVALLLVSPSAAQAYTVEDLLTVSRVAGEDYTALAQRAEMAARSMAQQRFDSDILLTRVIITVLGQNGGQTAPILVMDVNRNDWRNRPDPQRWSKYYRSTPVLLELDGSEPLRTPAPTTPPAPLPTPAPTNPASPTTPGQPGQPNQLNQPNQPNRLNQPNQLNQRNQLLPSGAASPPSINIPATPPGQVGLPRSILR